MSARTGKALIVVLLTLALLLVITPAALAFYDVPSSRPYYTQITDLASRKIVSGYADNSFHPLNGITRAQFAKMICLTYNLPVKESMTSPFTDLGPDNPNSLFPHEYVAAAYKAGITRGKSSTRFAPSERVVRLQVATMTMRGMMKYFPPNPMIFVTYDGKFLQGLQAAGWGDHLWWALEARNYQLLDPQFDFVQYRAALIYGRTPDYIVPEWAPMPRQEVAAFLYNVGHKQIGW